MHTERLMPDPDTPTSASEHTIGGMSARWSGFVGGSGRCLLHVANRGERRDSRGLHSRIRQVLRRRIRGWRGRELCTGENLPGLLRLSLLVVTEPSGS